MGWVGVMCLLVLLNEGQCIWIHPEVDMTLEQRVISHGYPIETYQLTTEDGYMPPLYHIPHGLDGKYANIKNKSVVLLAHGLGGSPHLFVVLGKRDSFPYYLADRGYDVWLFSARGVMGSIKKKHIKYDWNKDPNYWEFSLHEIGVYDLSAAIDFTLHHTLQPQLHLVGHSAGGNEFFALFSEKPQYNAKVKLAINWASSPILKTMDYALAEFLSALADFAKGLLNYMGFTECFPIIEDLKPTMRLLCADAKWQKLCILGSAIIGSHVSVLQSKEDIQVIVSNLPRISCRQVLHFMDNFNNGSFRQYDFGVRQNRRLYGQAYPPLYKLSRTTVPTAFFFGPHDGIIQLKDIHEAVQQIPNTILIYRVNFDKFTHTDFMFARNATYLVYEPTRKLIEDIDNGVVFPPIVPPMIN